MNDSTASALAEQGKKEYEKGAFLAAAKLFSRASQAYTQANDSLNAAEMKNNQSVAFLQGGKASDALQATEGTEEIFASAGDLKRQGISVSNRAAALEGMKKWSDALAEYERAASILERAGEGDMHSIVRKASANIHLKFGQVNQTGMDIYDSLRLVEKPTFTQRIMKFLMRIGLIR